MTTTSFAIGAMIAAMIAVLAVLGFGLWTFANGKDVSGVKANKLMWWRVYLQGIALALFAIALVLVKQG